MAVPTYVAAGTFQENTVGVTPGLPAGLAADDIMLLICQTEAGEAVTTPSGWTIVSGSPVENTTSPRVSVFWRRATGSDTAPTTNDPGDHIYAQIFAFRGCPTTGNPWDVTGTGTSSSNGPNQSIPAVTTTVADCLIVLVTTCWSDQTVTFSNGSLTSLTERADHAATAGFNGALAVATGIKTTAGSTGSTTTTYSGADARTAEFTVALKPSSGSAPVNASAGTGIISSTANAPGKGVGAKAQVIG